MKMKLTPTTLLTIAMTMVFSLTAPFAAAKGVNFNILTSTPVGSWTVREDTSIDHKGRATVAVVRTSMLAEEMRDGEKHFWIEMSMTNFKEKKGKRKQKGKAMVMKTLVPASSMQGDPANALNNLRGFGKEIVMQNGNDKPMLIRGSGGMVDNMMKSMGTEINYQYADAGSENITVPAGDFATNKIQGSGRVEMKILFNKLTVESTNTAWVSEKVPFGMVKNSGEDITNGKKGSHSSELLEFGMSGATSLIVGEPEEMVIPDMPEGMPSIFGG